MKILVANQTVVVLVAALPDPEVGVEMETSAVACQKSRCMPKAPETWKMTVWAAGTADLLSRGCRA